MATAKKKSKKKVATKGISDAEAKKILAALPAQTKERLSIYW